MQIKKGDRVTLFCSSYLEDGSCIDDDQAEAESFVMVAGEKGKSEVSTAVASALLGMKKDEVKHLKVPPRLAFGEVDQTKFVKMKMDNGRDLKTGDDVKVKMIIGNTEKVVEGTVQNIEGEYANVDTNHPLAGQCLYMKIQIVSHSS